MRLNTTNSTSTDVIFIDAWSKRTVVKYESYLSTASADTQMNEY